MHLSAKASRKLINIMTVVCGIIIIFLVIYWYRLGIFTSQTKMKAYLADKKVIG
ncbi:MAG TPA: TVP38/TMEM64 family protein, partial [Lactobacillus acetotolerans]|nr:TVP38/TMEM64 family protein [Lactobacillus acetotolerans]